jgi:hypothetical protein
MILIPLCLTLRKILTDLGLILDVWTLDHYDFNSTVFDTSQDINRFGFNP